MFRMEESSLVSLIAISGATLLFEHPRASEIGHFEIFSRTRENQLAQ